MGPEGAAQNLGMHRMDRSSTVDIGQPAVTATLSVG
jgi:hypothetical protein